MQCFFQEEAKWEEATQELKKLEEEGGPFQMEVVSQQQGSNLFFICLLLLLYTSKLAWLRYSYPGICCLSGECVVKLYRTPGGPSLNQELVQKGLTKWKEFMKAIHPKREFTTNSL